MLKGNKGEWSEIYTLLKLIGDGRIYSADENVEKIENMYFPILKIIRQETIPNKYEYLVGNPIQIYLNNVLIKEIPQIEFKKEAEYLYPQIVSGTDRTFSIHETEEFMYNIGCYRLAAPSTDKTDITMQIHDVQTGYNPICGFSIKSEIGNPPTLINATGATNFIFEVIGLDDAQIQEINSIESRSKIKDRMAKIFTYASSVNFVKTNSIVFDTNLMLIDSRLTELIAHTLIYHYRYGTTTCEEIIDLLERDNPMNYPQAGFYRYKFKKFLCSAALGMTPAKYWDGIDDANGGYIIVTSNGDVLAYHIYNRSFFEEYLLKQTKFERASTSRHGFASLYKDNGRTFIKLNLQIRFK